MTAEQLIERLTVPFDAAGLRRVAEVDPAANAILISGIDTWARKQLKGRSHLANWLAMNWEPGQLDAEVLDAWLGALTRKWRGRGQLIQASGRYVIVEASP